MDYLRYQQVATEEPVEECFSREADNEVKRNCIQASLRASKLIEEAKRTRKQDLKYNVIPLSQKLLLLRERNEQKVLVGDKAESVSLFKLNMSYSLVKMKSTFNKTKDAVLSWELWKTHMKEMGGKYGNGILSYFTFLRWILLLNVTICIMILAFLVIPKLTFAPYLCMGGWNEANVTVQIVHSNSNSSTTAQSASRPSVISYTEEQCTFIKVRDIEKQMLEKSFIENMADFFQGTLKQILRLARRTERQSNCDLSFKTRVIKYAKGWMNGTILFYGSYPNSFLKGFSGWIYNFPLAYLVIILSYLLLSIYLIVSNAIGVFAEGYMKQGTKQVSPYAVILFTDWDMGITSRQTADLQKQSLVNQLEAILEEERRLRSIVARTKMQKCCLLFLRVSVNFLIAASLGLAAWAIYYSTKVTEEALEKKVSTKRGELALIFESYASPITITAINFILPPLFFTLSKFEDWDPRIKVNVDLGRTVLLKLASISVLVITLYLRMQRRPMTCWENSLGAEMYKLIWTDFIVTVSVCLFVEFPRGYIARKVSCGCNFGKKIGLPEFSITDNVLNLVYMQTIVWIGAAFCPLLPVMAVIAAFVTFYMKKQSLVTNFEPPGKPYQAAKSNYFFMVLLLVSYTLSLSALLHAITQVKPSASHGPFRGFSRTYDIFGVTGTTLPYTFDGIYQVLISPVVIICCFIFLCLALYFFYSMSRLHEKKIKGLERQLALESREKKSLLKRLVADGSIDQNLSVQESLDHKDIRVP